MAIADRHEPRALDDNHVSRFLETLVSARRIAPGALERARHVALESNDKLENALTRLGILSERELAEVMAEYLHVSLLAPADYPATPVLAERLGARFLGETRVLPLRDQPASLLVGMTNPLDPYARQALRFAAGKELEIRVCYPSDFDAAFARLYPEQNSQPEQRSERTRATPIFVDDIDKLKDLASDAPVVRLVNQIITTAVEMRASDIHIEPMENELCVRYRIDGVLQSAPSPPQQLASAIVSRVKIMAKLNIAERRLAQDGRISMAVRGRDIDFRVSTSPTVRGESVVLRILDRSQLALDFSALGFEPTLADQFRALTAQPHGIVLITGPTGSGKTTTLYTALLELNTIERKILTIEDPVEYQLTGINQVQVKPQIGLTFANALRAFLRQDPDIMMVGEIRDLETAQVAVQAALTGHLILSTLHTNDAPGALTRLIDMGLEDYLLTSTINGIAAQRLVRLLCRHCRRAFEPSTELVERLSLGLLSAERPLMLHKAVGCEACRMTGYDGRTSIVEVLTMTEALRHAVLKRADASELQRLAREYGMVPLQQHGLHKALAGLTTVEEVLRVTQQGA
jgi:general secretion pathway protein E